MNISKYLILILVLSSFNNIYAKEKLSFLTADYCPLMCEGKNDKGILVDILEAIFENKYELDIDYKPLKRAFNEYEKQEYSGFIGGNRTQVGNNLFPNYVTAPNTVKFYKRDGFNWSYKGVNSLDEVRIAAVANFKYASEDLDKYILENKKKNVVRIDNTAHLDKFIELLEHKRIDVFVAGELVVEYYLKMKGIKNLTYASADVSVFKNYISINSKIKNSKKLLNELDKGFLRIHKNGQLRKIFKKYGVRRDIPLLK